jgi:aminoglycoside phosphotransferase (APT) family kinase protein
MPQPLGRDLEQTRARLLSWFAKRLPAAEELRIDELHGPGATGFSSDTLMFDLHSREAGERIERALVARLAPTSAFPVFPKYDIALQFDMLSALADTPVPVPTVHWLERDAEPLGSPFYVMERIDGLVPSDSPPYHTAGWLTELSPDARSKLWWSGLEAMSRVHTLDWQRPEFAFIERPAPDRTPIEHQLDYWDRYLDWGLERERFSLADRSLTWLRENRPTAEPTAICWGDSRISNQIFDDCECIAVIDWEMLFLGNPLADLAWFITLDRCLSEGLGAPRLDGMPARDETVERWESLTGSRATHFQYYEVFAAFRFTVVMGRVFKQLKHYEIMPQDAEADVHNMASATLELLMGDVGA